MSEIDQKAGDGMEMRSLWEKLDALYQRGDRKAIEEFLRSESDRATRSGDKGLLVSLSNEMIGLFRTQSRYEEGDAIFRETVQLCQSMGIRGTLPYAGTLLNGATMYRAAGRLTEAEALYDEVRTIYEEQLPKDDYRLAGFYNNYSLLLMEQRERSRACTCMEKALSILKLLPDTEGEQAVSHTNLASLCMELQDWEGAGDHLRQAGELFRLTPGDPHEASCLHALGQLYLHEGRDADALNCFRQAMDKIEGAYGRNRSWHTVCRTTSVLLRKMGQEEEAERYRRMSEDMP